MPAKKKRATVKSLNELLTLYDKEVRRFLRRHPTSYSVTIHLSPSFLKTCRTRIVEGHKKYGSDWKDKDNIKERDAEVFDHFNYTILDKCQHRHSKNH